MLKHYLFVALRNLRKSLAYSAINIAGLAIGIACCVLMLLYVQHELSFDTFHHHADRIWRLLETRQSPDKGERHFPFVMGPAGPALVREIPDVIDQVRMIDATTAGRFTVKHGENRFYEGDYIIAEPAIFAVFDFTLLEGNPLTALKEPRSIVLTQKAARTYFGTENPMGRVLALERYGDCIVTGLLQDPPENSHLDFSMVLSFSTLESIEGWQRYLRSWDSDGVITYILTSRKIDPGAFNARIAALVQNHRGEHPEDSRELAVQRLEDIHFGSANLESDRNSGKSELSTVYIFSVTALLVLLVACINYMNLATARSLKRAKEFGVRRVVGAGRSHVIGQLLSESVLVSVFSMIAAIALVEFFLPGFNTLAGTHLTISSGAPTLIIALPALTFAAGFVCGLYPAIALSRPGTLFTGTGGVRSSWARRVLVVFQFALAIVMIVATIVARDQLNYVHTTNLGFNQDQLLVIDINSGNTRRNFQAIKTEMSKIPSVRSVCVSSRVPGEWKQITQIEAVPEGAPDADQWTMYFFAIDEDFLQTFQMNLIAGRNLSGDMGTDTAAILINETAARLLGWDEPLNKELRVPSRNFRAHVVGVVRDFHFQSLHEPIGPVVLGHWKNPFYPIDYFTCRIRGNDVPGTLATLQNVHERFDHITPFEYNFLDQRIDDFYRRDIRAGNILEIAANLTVFIACLGLLGLAAFMAQHRMKEIGIRKTLGASVTSVVSLLSMDFVKLVLVANLLAWPVAWFAMHRWLENFAYRVDLSWWMFALAGAVALVIALLTVSTQAIGAALANPVKSLRHE